GPNGESLPASFIEKVVYKLHPTFAQPNRTLKKPPFKLEEQGWGEFDLEVALTFAEKAGEKILRHDLHFQQQTYEVPHVLSFKNPKPGLTRLLAESGAVPGMTSEDPSLKKDKRKLEDVEKHKKKKSDSMKSIDMDKLAEGLQKLQEDDLLQIVQMVNEAKTPSMYVKNDVEGLPNSYNNPTFADICPEGEFHLDLYTLPDTLLRDMWNFTTSKVAV
ncbi:Transcription initiation factor TFIID subunit 14, partial [Neolecta irregularis DAH-3]